MQIEIFVGIKLLILLIVVGWVTRSYATNETSFAAKLAVVLGLVVALSPVAFLPEDIYHVAQSFLASYNMLHNRVR